MTPKQTANEIDLSIQRALSDQSLHCNEMFKSVLIVIDMSLQIELSRVMSASTTGEARAHSAGRLDALNDMLVELQSRRQAATAGTNTAQTKSPAS